MRASPLRFDPTSLTVNVNTTVVWYNATGGTHTVTSDVGSELDSNNIGGGKFFSHKFESAGTFAYHCALHTSMTGSITVEP